MTFATPYSQVRFDNSLWTGFDSTLIGYRRTVPAGGSIRITWSYATGQSLAEVHRYAAQEQQATQPLVNTSGRPSDHNQGACVLANPAVTVSCPATGETCTTTTQATTIARASAVSTNIKKKFVIGRAILTTPAGASNKITFNLNPTGLKLLRRLGKLTKR